ncbi:MAG: carboxylate-amine ligase [Gammaproteobacteria bacterium]|nr:carboxylate-amine ligase [Gammaproteobacteria bacterium]|tara:strand:+ start:5919 stop:7055 length:1137 start_codon:yes stop_codon:yes gene_type:complete
MEISEPAFSIGVEEEYLLVDRETRDLVSDPPSSLMEEFSRDLGGHVSPELMRAQIEAGTTVCSSVKEARQEIIRLRNIIAEVSSHYGYAPLAASSHPFARWIEQKQTEKARYSALTNEMQAAARHLLICGMHVHVGIENPELRIDLMNQMSYFLPHLLAFSTSSPFWEGENTGLKSYRLTVFDALPRTGLPEQFASFGEYERHVQILVNAGLVEDASMIWWDLRPSTRFPTLETRIMDVATDVNHAISLVALNICLLRMLCRTRQKNQRWRVYAKMLIDENRWRAMRYSYEEGLIDFAKGQVVPCADLLEELLEFIGEDAEALDCVDEIEALRDIIANGTSAHRQLQVYEDSCSQGADHEQAVKDVVDWLVEETVRNI